MLNKKDVVVVRIFDSNTLIEDRYIESNNKEFPKS